MTARQTKSHRTRACRQAGGEVGIDVELVTGSCGALTARAQIPDPVGPSAALSWHTS